MPRDARRCTQDGPGWPAIPYFYYEYIVVIVGFALFCGQVFFMFWIQRLGHFLTLCARPCARCRCNGDKALPVAFFVDNCTVMPDLSTALFTLGGRWWALRNVIQACGAASRGLLSSNDGARQGVLVAARFRRVARRFVWQGCGRSRPLWWGWTVLCRLRAAPSPAPLPCL